MGGPGGPQGFGPPGGPGGPMGGQQGYGQPGGPMGGPPMGAPMGGPMGGPPMGGPPMGAPMGGPMGAPMGSPVGAAAPSKGGALKVIGGAVLIGGAMIAIGIGAWYVHSHPSVYVVNVTGTDGVTVYVDGEPLTEGLKNAAAENNSLVSRESVKAGPHKVEAKDASGKVLESLQVDFQSGFGSTYVYAPARNPQICFFVQTDEYKTNDNAPDKVKDRFKPLDPTKTMWLLPDSIDYWFQDSPENITIKTDKKGKAASSVVKRALRQGKCNDPEFQG